MCSARIDARIVWASLKSQLFNHLQHRCSEEEVHDIVTEAVVIEKEFLSDALPVGLIGINANVS